MIFHSKLLTNVFLILAQTQFVFAAKEEIVVPSLFIGFDLNGTGVNLPLIGAGTWQYNNSIAYQSVCKAFQAGYTFVDTALGYGNQKGVGLAIRDCWQRPERSCLS